MADAALTVSDGSFYVCRDDTIAGPMIADTEAGLFRAALGNRTERWAADGTATGEDRGRDLVSKIVRGYVLWDGIKLQHKIGSNNDPLGARWTDENG